MSDLNSVFNQDYGFPNGSALEDSFKPAAGVALPAGTIVYLNTLQLKPVSALSVKSDAAQAGSPPAGQAIGDVWVVDTWGAGYNDGDMVELTSTGPDVWTVIVARSGTEPPDGTRVLVKASDAAGSFAGQEEKIGVFTAGAPGSWAFTTPVTGNEVQITGSSRYAGNEYVYEGTHPAGAWVLMGGVVVKATGYMDKLTSDLVANPKHEAWIVIEGTDQYDSQACGRITCLKLGTGMGIKMACAAANLLAVGDFVQANAGALEKCTGVRHPVGQVVYTNGVAGSGGVIRIVA